MDPENAIKALNIAKAAIQEGNFEKAKRFLEKSLKSNSDLTAQALYNKLPELERHYLSKSKEAFTTPNKENSFVNKSSSATSTSANMARAQPKKEYPVELVALIRMINTSKSFYKVLGITVQATPVELKKAYKKMALKLHPDKTDHPEADEAFKRVQRSFDVLSDVSQRRTYDLSGDSEDAFSSKSASNLSFRNGGASHNMHNMFNGGANPFGGSIFEELFRNSTTSNSRPGFNSSGPFQFSFGTGFPNSSQFNHRHYHQQQQNRQNRQHQKNGDASETNSSSQSTVYFWVVIFIIMLQIIPNLFSASQSNNTKFRALFKLERDNIFYHTNYTANKNVKYFTKIRNPVRAVDEIHRLHKDVELAYGEKLSVACTAERKKVNALKSRGIKANKASRAQFELPSCDLYNEFMSV